MFDTPKAARDSIKHAAAAMGDVERRVEVADLLSFRSANSGSCYDKITSKQLINPRENGSMVLLTQFRMIFSFYTILDRTTSASGTPPSRLEEIMNCAYVSACGGQLQDNLANKETKGETITS